MFVLLSKLLDHLFAPLSWALLLGLVALVLLRRRPALARGLLGAGLLVLCVFSLAPVADRLMALTERGARTTFRPDVTYDAVIVLGGGMDLSATELTGEPEFNEAPERFLRGVQLVREGHARHLLVTGGTLDPRPEAPTEGRFLTQLAEAWGLPRERLVAEARSRNTRENAVYTAELVKARGWKTLLLVTSAFHMPRSVGCFAAVGLHPDTLPVDFRSPPSYHLGGSWQPRAEALERSTTALRELAGRLVYRVRGYSVPVSAE